MSSFIPPLLSETEGDKCALCFRSAVLECIDCLASPIGECLIIWGECGHRFHSHCFDKQSRKEQFLCRADDKLWCPVGLTESLPEDVS
jgi:RING-box protein 1